MGLGYPRGGKRHFLKFLGLIPVCGRSIFRQVIELNVLLFSLRGVQVEIELDDDDAVLGFLERPPPPETVLLRDNSIEYLFDQPIGTNPPKFSSTG